MNYDNWKLAHNVENCIAITNQNADCPIAIIKTKQEKGFGREVHTVPDSVKQEFGPCTFYLYSSVYGDTCSLVKLDPFMGTIQYLDNDAYVEQGIISWEKPEKLRKFIINKEEFFTSYSSIITL